MIDLPSYSEGREIHVVIETTRGSGSKFKYNPELGVFTLHRVLPQGLVFPYAFGFIPSTRSEDGDPLDVLFLTETDLFTGCVVCVHLIGVIKARQQEHGKVQANDRLVAIDPMSPRWGEIEEIAALPERLLAEIEHFFMSYRMPGAIEFTVTGRGDAEAAHRLVSEGIARAQAA